MPGSPAREELALPTQPGPHWAPSTSSAFYPGAPGYYSFLAHGPLPPTPTPTPLLWACDHPGITSISGPLPHRSLSTSRPDPWPLSPLESLKPFHLGATGICDHRLPGLPSTLELPTLFPLGTAVPRAQKPHILKPTVFRPGTQVSSGTLLSRAHTPLCAGETRESRLGDPSLQLDGGAEAGVCVRGCSQVASLGKELPGGNFRSRP